MVITQHPAGRLGDPPIDPTRAAEALAPRGIRKKAAKLAERVGRRPCSQPLSRLCGWT